MCPARNRAEEPASTPGESVKSLSDIGPLRHRDRGMRMHSKKDMPIRDKGSTTLSHLRGSRNLRVLIRAKFAHDFGGIAMLAVDGFVHGAHVVCGDFSGQGVESGLESVASGAELRSRTSGTAW